MSTDFVAVSDEGFVTQLSNLSGKAASVQATLGLTAADVTAITADYTAMQAAVVDVAAKLAAYQSAVQGKNATRAGVEKRLRSLAKRIKGNAAYTPAIGELLGLVASGSNSGGTTGAMARARVAEVAVQPQLKGSVSGDGTVAVRFMKKSYSGVMLYGRRGSETEFGLLSKQLVSPYVDDRENLAAGVPETREYRAQYFRNDQPIGQMSDILVVTVPAGKAAETAPAPAPVLKAVA